LTGVFAGVFAGAFAGGFAVFGAGLVPCAKPAGGTAIAKNPFTQFTVKGAKAGDKISVSWVDNRGDQRSDEATVS